MSQHSGVEIHAAIAKQGIDPELFLATEIGAFGLAELSTGRLTLPQLTETARKTALLNPSIKAKAVAAEAEPEKISAQRRSELIEALELELQEKLTAYFEQSPETEVKKVKGRVNELSSAIEFTATIAYKSQLCHCKHSLPLRGGCELEQAGVSAGYIAKDMAKDMAQAISRILEQSRS